MRHKDATRDTPQEMLETIQATLASPGHYPYPPVVWRELAMVEAQVEFLSKAVQEGMSWAAGEPQERAVRLVVHFVTRTPLLMFEPDKNDPMAES